MMSVLEYAQDVNKTVKQILDRCQKLNIDVKSEDDELDEEVITILDNDIMQDEEEDNDFYEDELIEKEKNKILDRVLEIDINNTIYEELENIIGE